MGAPGGMGRGMGGPGAPSAARKAGGGMEPPVPPGRQGAFDRCQSQKTTVHSGNSLTTTNVWGICIRAYIVCVCARARARARVCNEIGL